MHLKLYFYLSLVFCHGNTDNETNIEFNLFLNDLISSLERIINFYQNNLSSFNLDGIFGLKILQGELTNILTIMDVNLFQLFLKAGDLDFYFKNKNSFITRLKNLRCSSQNLSRKAITYIKKDDFAYYQRMKYFVINEWKPKILYRKINRAIEIVKGVRSAFDESFSDECLSSVAKYTNYNFQNTCKILDECRDVLLLRKGLKEYFVTHQVLYTTIIQKSSCLVNVNEMLLINHTSIDQLQKEFCSQIFFERNHTFSLQSPKNISHSIIFILPTEQDLFLEQIFVCGSIGFMEFVDLKFLRTVISWISSNGCFKLINEDETKSTFGKRDILEEAYFTDGCLAHKTSLGIAVLSLYLRLFFDSNVNYYFQSQYPIIKLLQNERLQFERRKNPFVLNNQMTLSEIIAIANKMTFSWIPYFNKTDKTLKITNSRNFDSFVSFLFLLFLLIAILLLRKRFSYCIGFLINRMKINVWNL